MKLNDARRLAVRSRIELEFDTAGGMLCVIGDDGVARMPGLRSAAGINISDEFERAAQFRIRERGEVRQISRQELESLCGGQKAAAVEHHDE
jgi:hypothetical protein